MEKLYYACAVFALSSLVACATNGSALPNNNVVTKNGSVVISPPRATLNQKMPKVVEPPAYIYSR